ncbi:methyltransferase-like protein, partial [Kipferlia bialata]
TAIDVLKTRPRYAGCARLTAQTLDLTVSQLPPYVPRHAYSYATLIFVLSAIPEALHPQCMANVASMLGEGGVLLFHDYHSADVRVDLFEAKGQAPQAEGEAGPVYKRGGEDTLAIYFRTEYLRSLFSTLFTVEEVVVRTKQEHNRKTDKRWSRSFVFAKCRVKSRSQVEVAP